MNARDDDEIHNAVRQRVHRAPVGGVGNMIDPRILDVGVVLASASPRRRELLETVGIPFEVMPSDADESSDAGTTPAQTAIGNARAKAHLVAARTDGSRPVIGCDTIVVLDGTVFGKPADDADARRILDTLSGRTHDVISGVCITDGVRERVFSVDTAVTFRTLDARTVDSYIASGEPADKAGAYGIQGKGMLLVERVCGDYPNVVGLPVVRLVDELNAFIAGEDDLIATEETGR